MKRTRRTTVPGVAETADVLESIPGLRVDAVRLGSEVFLRPASASVIAVEGTVRALTGISIVPGKAVAESGRSVADTLVRAFGHGMQIVGIGYLTYPSYIHRTGTK